MKINISVVREILIPLSEYPHIQAAAPLSMGIALLTEAHSEGYHPIRFDSLLVVNETGEYLGQFDLRSVLKQFFEPAMRPLTAQFPLRDSDSYADTVVAINDWFKFECQQKSTAAIGEYLSIQQSLPSVTPSCHMLEALDHMLHTESSVLPVIENDVLLGAVRLQDVFGTLAASIQPESSTKNTFFTEG